MIFWESAHMGNKTPAIINALCILPELHSVIAISRSLPETFDRRQVKMVNTNHRGHLYPGELAEIIFHAYGASRWNSFEVQNVSQS